MHLFIVHNAYIDRGGEDMCVANEATALREAGLQVTLWEVQNRNSLTAMKQALEAPWSGGEEGRLEEALERERPDILHAHNLYPLLSPRVFTTAHRLGIRTVQTLHNYRPLCLNGLFMTPHKETCERCAGGNLWPGILRGCYRGSRLQSAGLASHIRVAFRNHAYDAVDQFIAPSSFLKSKYVSNGFSKKKIVVQHHFLSVFPQEQPVKPEPYLVYLGRLSEEKGLLWLLKTFSQLSLPLKLVIAGDGPLRAEAENAAASSSIHYIGHISGDAKEDLLRRATALVIPSECYENFPLSVVEANAVGTPAIVSDQGGLHEIVKPGINGERYASKDAKSFETVVLSIFKKDDPMPLRQSSQNHARDHFTRQKFLQDRMGIYQSLLQPALAIIS